MDPAIDDPELRARLMLGQREFVAHVDRFTGRLAAQRCDEAAIARALGYPWARPARSYVLRDDVVELVEDLPARRRAAALDRFTRREPRTPLLAIGANAAPDTLRRKLGGLEDRDVLVIAGHLEAFDVGPSAHLAIYGALPATLFPSPGTAVRAAILWLTAPQFTQLVWSELSYAVGRLETRFAADEPAFDAGGVVAFVSRFGVFCPDGEPVALAAVPARRRTARALSQRDLLALIAERLLDDAGAVPTLLRLALERPQAVRPRVAQMLRARARPFTAPGWTPLVGPSAAV